MKTIYNFRKKSELPELTLLLPVKITLAYYILLFPGWKWNIYRGLERLTFWFHTHGYGEHTCAPMWACYLAGQVATETRLQLQHKCSYVVTLPLTYHKMLTRYSRLGINSGLSLYFFFWGHLWIITKSEFLPCFSVNQSTLASSIALFHDISATFTLSCTWKLINI